MRRFEVEIHVVMAVEGSSPEQQDEDAELDKIWEIRKALTALDGVYVEWYEATALD